jgi:TolB-like protein/class 3 adenylate cyclase
MAADSYKRKLTAILSADVKGYSRLMGENETETVKTLTTYRKMIGDLIEQHHGRVVDSPGDNLLAEFASVVDAVQCAVAVQAELKTRNADLSESRRMHFRIGITLGDVIEEEGRIYGDGVNIAARVEGLAEPGGICLSRTAFDQVKNKLSLGFKYLGEHSVKNITEPIRVYCVLPESEAVGKIIDEKRSKKLRRKFPAIAGALAVLVIAGGLVLWHFQFRPPPIEPARVDKMAHPLPEKPSIAVLPFFNMSGSADQDFFCDGFTDQIITSLAKIPQLFIIASNSSFTYKGKPAKVQDVAREMGVRYVLEGSIQRAEKKIRVRAQLIDAVSGHHLWAESYDRDLEDVFAIQDEIAGKIITSLQVTLTSGEYARAVGKATKNLEALQYWWRAQAHYIKLKKEDNALAKQYAEKALELDPRFATAWAELGFTHLMDSMNGWSSSREESMKLAEECARKALSLNPSELKTQLLACRIAYSKREHDKAIEYAEKAASENPNDPYAFNFLAISMMMAGRHVEAVANARKAIRQTPHYPPHFLIPFNSAFLLRQYDEAIWAGEKMLEASRKGLLAERFGYTLLIAVYSEMGQEEKARQYASEFLKLQPSVSLGFLKRIMTYKNPADQDRILNALRKAGIPD